MEVSEKQSDPEQPSRLLFELLNPPDVIALLFEAVASLLGRNHKFLSRQLQNNKKPLNLRTFKNGGFEPSLFWLKIFPGFDLEP